MNSFVLLLAFCGVVAGTFFDHTLPCGCAPPPPPPCLCAPPLGPLPCAAGCGAAAPPLLAPPLAPIPCAVGVGVGCGAAAPALLPAPAAAVPVPVHPCGAALGGCGGSAGIYAHPLTALPPGYIIIMLETLLSRVCTLEL
uniref:Uncharacterized protein n=1 Tax=Steinernema glaseri TaxID=37863 RepID=A0A1I7ZYQ2_9BILA